MDQMNPNRKAIDPMRKIILTMGVVAPMCSTVTPFKLGISLLMSAHNHQLFYD